MARQLASLRAVDAVEAQIDECRIVTFDGRVLEVFGGETRRFHGQLCSLRLPPPDKKGITHAVIVQSGREWPLDMEADALDRFQVVLAALRAAGVRVTE